VDSGSTDDTIAMARSLGAAVIEQSWLGFSGQRDFALQLPVLLHDWVYFVDADEWVSTALAHEIAHKLRMPSFSAFAQRLRLVFQDTWIRHCGWYGGSWQVRLVDRRCTKFDGTWIARAQVVGPIGALANDLVDQDEKGLALWLHKHVSYAQLEARRRQKPQPLRQRIRTFYPRDPSDTRPISRAFLKEIIFPSVPAKPLAIFLYMYILRLGFLDGHTGLRFCFYHAWFEVNVAAIQAGGTAEM
jgi:glycosyltransferase involved in cell wall biosynthesis